MKIRKALKITIDILMYGLYVWLMGYRIIRGLDLHGILGIVLLVLFIAHHVLNISWWKVIFKGKYSSRRIGMLVTDLLLLLAMAGLAVSSMLHLCQVFATPWYIPMTQFSRDLHLISGAWGFVVMSVHVGFHTLGVQKKLIRKAYKPLWKVVFSALYILVFAFGIYSFYRSGLWSDMFLLMAEKQSYINQADFFTGYLFVTIAICQTVGIIHALLNCKKS